MPTADLAALMKSSTIAVIGIFAILVILVFLSPQSAKHQMQGALLQLISPILRTGASVGHEIGGVSGGLKHLDELQRENEQLRSENEQLRAENSLLANLETEVNRLNRALGFREQSPFKLLPARVVTRETATWWSTCTISIGSKDGVAPDMAVVTESGLVGKVTTVGKDISVVLLVSDESLRVSVSIEGTQEQGIISGTRASSMYAPDLRIRFLSKTAQLQPGMKVLTAGTGGVFPSGLVVGTVKDFSSNELEGIAKVTPAVDLAEIENVFVILRQK
jgi:rod shape-determining protein MreC